MRKKKFKLHWKDGRIEVIYGTTISNAFLEHGYDNTLLTQLDYFEDITYKKDE